MGLVQYLRQELPVCRNMLYHVIRLRQESPVKLLQTGDS